VWGGWGGSRAPGGGGGGAAKGVPVGRRRLPSAPALSSQQRQQAFPLATSSPQARWTADSGCVPTAGWALQPHAATAWARQRGCGCFTAGCAAPSGAVINCKLPHLGCIQAPYMRGDALSKLGCRAHSREKLLDVGVHQLQGLQGRGGGGRAAPAALQITPHAAWTGPGHAPRGPGS